VAGGDRRALAQLISARKRQAAAAMVSDCARRPQPRHAGAGITGTGGAGKSSLTDELIRRFRLDQDDALRSP
jgi:methylmalonyl-CoA mutase